MNRFFSNNGDCFETHATEGEARAAAEHGLDYFRDESGEGWSEEVEHVCWGEIRQQSTQVDVVTTETADEAMADTMKAEGWDYHCDYQLADVDPPMDGEEMTSAQKLASREVWIVERHVDFEFGEVRDACATKAEALVVALKIREECSPGYTDWNPEESEDGSVSWEFGSNTVRVERYLVPNRQAAEETCS